MMKKNIVLNLRAIFGHLGLSLKRLKNSITVTFDSNVWENIVDEKKRVRETYYRIIYQHILDGLIVPYFFEGLATMETIKRENRKEYFKNYKPTICIKINDEEKKIKKGSSAPELSKYLKQTIPKALGIGFKFIKFSRIGNIKLEIDDEYYATDEQYLLEERLERSQDFSRYIEKIKAGKATVNVEDDKKKYAKGIAEWVDGDALSAHYGYGIDYFCTNDKASGAGKASVFARENLTKLKDKFNINVLSPYELKELLSKK